MSCVSGIDELIAARWQRADKWEAICACFVGPSPTPPFLNIKSQLRNFRSRPIHYLRRRPRLVEIRHTRRLLIVFIVQNTDFRVMAE